MTDESALKSQKGVVKKERKNSKSKAKIKTEARIKTAQLSSPKGGLRTRAKKDSNDFFLVWQHTCWLGTAIYTTYATYKRSSYDRMLPSLIRIHENQPQNR